MTSDKNKVTLTGVTISDKQYENLNNKNDLNYLENFYGEWGIGLVADTNLSVIRPYEKIIKHIMVMCSQPGISAAKFDERNISRIRTINKEFPNLKVQVDGGIENIKASIMRTLNVDLIVSGSYLSRANNLFDHVYRLKYGNDEKILVSQIMKTKLELPCVAEETSFMDIINSINYYRMGIVFVIDKDWNLKGIITDGDIRRAFIKYERDIFEKKAMEIMNSNPFSSTNDTFIYSLMERLSHSKKVIRVIPVIQENKLIGAVNLNSSV